MTEPPSRQDAEARVVEASTNVLRLCALELLTLRGVPLVQVDGPGFRIIIERTAPAGS
jgi:hypothetical protein